MLSGELATLLAGRYVEFAIYPFSYTEFLGITQKENNKVHYLEYMQSSGMPELYHLSQPEVQRNYISALKDTVLLRDIIQRQNIKCWTLYDYRYYIKVQKLPPNTLLGNIRKPN